MYRLCNKYYVWTGLWKYLHILGKQVCEIQSFHDPWQIFLCPHSRRMLFSKCLEKRQRGLSNCQSRGSTCSSSNEDYNPLRAKVEFIRAVFIQVVHLCEPSTTLASVQAGRTTDLWDEGCELCRGRKWLRIKLFCRTTWQLLFVLPLKSGLDIWSILSSTSHSH